MRLGRQRWRLKGRIEPDDSQTWDEEEKAFVPTMHENLEIKVGQGPGWDLAPGCWSQTPPSCPSWPGDRASRPELNGGGCCDLRHR